MKPAQVLGCVSDAPPSPKTSEDLSAEIIESIPRLSGDRVTCRRINGDRYRCNWWHPQDITGHDNPKMLGLLVTTHRVRKSEFLRATKAGGQLQINPQSAI